MILLKAAKCFLLRYLSFVKYTWSMETNSTKKSRQKRVTLPFAETKI